MGGCDYHLPRFSVAMNNPLGKCCENCEHVQTKVCADCCSWNKYEKKNKPKKDDMEIELKG